MFQQMHMLFTVAQAPISCHTMGIGNKGSWTDTIWLPISNVLAMFKNIIKLVKCIKNSEKAWRPTV